MGFHLLQEQAEQVIINGNKIKKYPVLHVYETFYKARTRSGKQLPFAKQIEVQCCNQFKQTHSVYPTFQ